MYSLMGSDDMGMGPNVSDFVDPYNNRGLFMSNSRYYNGTSFEIDDTSGLPINVLSVDQFQTDVTVNNGTVTGTVYLYGEGGK